MEIKVLSPEVVDQIAAGEVVERPAHLVKELVENSIDAGATQLSIEYAEGGRYVKVTDNGIGIAKDQLGIALLRFATSKIEKSDDLWHLRSFGFRGEALASISSVSRLTLVSRQKESETAYQLISEFGKHSEVCPIGGSFGTTILVENLFSNVPARLKFLKTDAGEHAAIRQALKAIALAHPQVDFRVTENNKLIYYWPAQKTKLERVQQILEVSPMYIGEGQRENVKAYSVFADPHQVAKTSKNIWIFVQNRWVQDRSIQAAVTESYRNLLMHGEYPIAVVWVETDPESVDVNIHPTKSQVKFADQSLAFRAVAASLRDALEKAPWLKQAPIGEDKNWFGLQNQIQNHNLELNLKMNPESSTLVTSESKNRGLKINPELTDLTQSRTELNLTQIEPGDSKKSSENMSFQDQELSRTQFAKKDFQRSPSFEFQQNSKFPEPQRISIQDLKQIAQKREELGNHWSRLEVIGQANLTYIVCQTQDRLVFVDQHAAHERVAFERLMSAWRGGKIDVQEFLFPLNVDLSPEKIEAIKTVFKDIEQLGIYLEELGPSTIGVKAAPLIIKESILPSVLENIAAEILELGGSFQLEKMIGDVCARMACHSVVRAGQALGVDQMKNLLREMDEFPMSSFCPHGRPVSVDYPYYKLEKDFGRIV